MSNPDTPWRDNHDGKAPAGMFRAARKWSSRFGRWHGVSTDERLQDFESAEQQDENENERHKRS